MSISKDVQFLQIGNVRIRPEEIGSYASLTVPNSNPVICIYRKNIDIFITLTFDDVEIRDTTLKLLDEFFEVHSI